MPLKYKNTIFASVGLIAVIFAAYFGIKLVSQNQSDFYAVNFPSQYNQALVLNAFENVFSVEPLGASASAATSPDNLTVRYENAYQNTDVVQTRQTAKIKEEIILKSPGHPDKFEYRIDLGKYDFLKAGKGDLYFYAKGKRGDELHKLFTIPASFMIDANGAKSYSVKTKMKEDGILTLEPDKNWLAQATYPVVLDPTIEINILNIHSHPVRGENWEVEFTTQGKADLKIIPNDQATIDDDEFVSLSCGNRNLKPQILAGDVIFYPNWQCDDIAKVVHYTKKTGKHTLRFEFGNQTVFAYNSTVIATDNFDGNTESPLATNWSTATINTADGLKGISNGAAPRTLSVNNSSFWDTASFDNDQYSQIKILDNTGYPGVILRHDTTKNNFYSCHVRDVNRVRIGDGAGLMTITTITNTGRYTNGGTLKCDVVGSLITIYWDGSSQGTYNDTSNYAVSGPPGIWSYGISTAAPNMDDFEAGNTADAGPTVTPLTSNTAHSTIVGAKTGSAKMIVNSPPGSGIQGLASGLVGYWTFDGSDLNWISATTGTAADKSVSGNTGTLTNMSRSTSPAIGKVGQALSFDGVDDSVNAGSGSSLDDIELQGGGGMTISAWIYVHSDGGKTYSAIATKNEVTDISGRWWLIISNDKVIRFEKNYVTTPLTAYTSADTFAFNSWQHIVVTWDGSASSTHIHFYVNGAEKNHTIDQDGAGAKNSDAANDLYIGNGVWGGRAIDGLIDEFRIYNRVLGASEVMDLYRLGARTTKFKQ